MPDDDPVRVIMRATVRAGDERFDLGFISGDTPQGLCDDLADRLEHLADVLRGPKSSPAEPCEGCGTPMVHRRGHPGRYTVVSRAPDGEVAIFGIHDVTGCINLVRRLVDEETRG